MLAALIANLQNERPEKLPTVHVDRGGGGQSWPSYDIVDIATAIQLFPEVAGEDSVARAVRRQKWIGEALPGIREARERRDAQVFLAGASIADAAAEERHRVAEVAAEERRRLVDQLEIEQLIAIIDDVRGTPQAQPPPPPRRGSGAIPILVALGLGITIGIGLTRPPRRHRSRGRLGSVASY